MTLCISSVRSRYIQDTYMVSRAREDRRVTADRHELPSGLRKPVLNWVGGDGWMTEYN